MKRILIILILSTVMLAAAFAEEKVLLDNKTSVGFYGGPAVTTTAIDNQIALLVGGSGAAIINKTFSIGGGGYALRSPVQKSVAGSLNSLNFGYGGLELGVTLGTDWLIHFSGNLLLGTGKVNLEGSSVINSDIYVIEPHAYMEINALEWMRICLGGGYRFVFGITDNPEIVNSDLWGPNGELMIKFGSF